MIFNLTLGWVSRRFCELEYIFNTRVCSQEFKKGFLPFLSILHYKVKVKNEDGWRNWRQRIISADIWTHTSVWRHATIAAATTTKPFCNCVCVCVCVFVCVCVCVCVCVQTHNEKRESKLVFMVLSARKRGTECKNDQIWKSFQVSSRRHLLVFRTMNLIYHASFYIIWAWRLTHECTLPWSLQMHFLLYTLRKSLEYATIKRVCTSNLRFYFYVL